MFMSGPDEMLYFCWLRPILLGLEPTYITDADIRNGLVGRVKPKGFVWTRQKGDLN